jgi:hypothetical protein
MAVAACTGGSQSGASGTAGTNEGADPVADSLIGDWVLALGGMETFWEVSTARFTLTTEMYNAGSGRLRRTRPRYVTIQRGEGGELARIERWEGDDFIEQGWDGTEAWARLNGTFLPDTAKDRREVEYVSGDVNYWAFLPFKLRDPGVNLAYEGKDAGGRHIVRVTFGVGVGDHQDTWTYLFTEGISWPAEVWYQEPSMRAPNRTIWENPATVGGYTFPQRRVYVNDSDQVTKVITISDFELNPELPAGSFGRPGG